MAPRLVAHVAPEGEGLAGQPRVQALGKLEAVVAVVGRVLEPVGERLPEDAPGQAAQLRAVAEAGRRAAGKAEGEIEAGEDAPSRLDEGGEARAQLLGRLRARRRVLQRLQPRAVRAPAEHCVPDAVPAAPRHRRRAPVDHDIGVEQPRHDGRAPGLS